MWSPKLQSFVLFCIWREAVVQNESKEEIIWFISEDQTVGQEPVIHQKYFQNSSIVYLTLLSLFYNLKL